MIVDGNFTLTSMLIVFVFIVIITIFINLNLYIIKRQKTQLDRTENTDMNITGLPSDKIPTIGATGKFSDMARPPLRTVLSNYSQILANLSEVEQLLGQDEDGADNGPMSTAYELVAATHAMIL